jgi:uncharacterized protein (TIGR04141 family)
MVRNINTKTHNIFLVDKNKIEVKFFDNVPQSVDDIIFKLMENHYQYKEQILKDDYELKSVGVRIFFFGNEKHNSKLASFCQTFVSENQEIITFRPKMASSILFVWSDNHIFTITTGQGYRIIDEYCVPKFGLQVASIFEKFRITALDSNGMSGIIHSSKTIYSNEVDLLNIDSLDIIFKEVTGRLTDKAMVHSLLRLNSKSKKSSMKIIAKNYVQFSSSLDFQGLLYILDYIDQYDFDQLTDKFNLILPLRINQHKEQIEANNEFIIHKVYNSITTDSTIGFDIFHSNTMEFLNADVYELNIDEVEPVSFEDTYEINQAINEEYKKYLQGTADVFDIFKKFLCNVKINAFKGDDLVTSDYLLKHISGEIQVDDKNYYIFYGDQYYLTEGYSERLNKSLEGKLKNEMFINQIKTLWNDGDDEDEFNKNVSINENYIHLHKVKPELIEFADLLQIDKNNVTIIHVKDKFDGSMRELDRQIELSFMRMIDLKNNNNDNYFRNLYQNASKHSVGVNISTKFKTEDDFVTAMKKCTYSYIMVLHADNKNLMESRSNIAKHCLNSLIYKCFNQGIDLKINLV